MKLTSLLLLINIIQLNAAISGFSQNERFSIKSDKIYIKELLDKIEAESHYKFLYRSDYLNNSSISVNAKNATLEELLTEALGSTDITFKVLANDLVVIAPKEFANSVQQKITGRVTDATTNEAVGGASVQIEGTTIGVITDNDGIFSIDAGPNAVLLISFVGYIAEKITVTTQTTYNVSLIPDVKNLEEVVVVGYGTQKRSDLTGSVASVKAKDLQNVPSPNLADALQGHVAGLYISQSTGSPGAGDNEVLLRGAGNLSGIQPLWIIDGVAFGGTQNTGTPDASFNPNDVESIEVLKDASATAIYGSRAAGGVMLVTTKKGKKGKPQINFGTYQSITTAYSLPKLLGKSDLIKVNHAYSPNDSIYKISQEQIDAYPTTDWNKVMYRTGSKQNYDFNISGGTDYASYFMGMNYYRETGVKVGTSFERFDLRLNTDHKLAKFFSVGQTLYLARTNTDPSNSDNSMFNTSPGMAVYDASNPYAQGNLGTWGYQKVGSSFLGYNPFASEMSDIQKRYQESLEGTLYVTISPVKNLDWKTTGGLRASKDFSSDSRPRMYISNDSKKDFAQYYEGRSENYHYTFNSVLTYNLTANKHKITPMVGLESIQGTSGYVNGEFDYYTGVYYPKSLDEAIESNDPTNLQKKTASSGTGLDPRLFSVFGRLNYAFADKYLLTFNIRRDGSSQFGPQNKYGVFPSFSAAWKISEESFMKQISFISTMKIRAGYGLIGNDQSISQYTYIKYYERSYTPYSFGDYQGVTGFNLQSKLPNNGIKWESLATTNIGIDAGFLNNKLQATLEYYNKDTRDFLYPLPIPVSLGLGNFVSTNVGKVRNNGVELSLNYHDTKGDFSYNFGVSGNFAKNKVVELDAIDNAPFYGRAGTEIQQGSETYFKTEVGRPLGSFYGLKALGIWQEGETINVKNADGTVPRAGDLKYEDKNHDGIISTASDSTDDREYLGNPWPKFMFGINGSIAFQGFDLSFLFAGQAGVQVANMMQPYLQSKYLNYDMGPAIFGNSMFLGNGVTSQPGHLYTDAEGKTEIDPNGNYKHFSSYWVENGSFIKLRNLQIGYTVPNRWLSSIGVAKLRVYIMGQNLFCWTKYSGIDPETTSAGNPDNNNTRDARFHGLADDKNKYPSVRTYSIGLDLGF